MTQIEADVRGGVEFWNPQTREYVFRDEQFDTESEWDERGVHDVCCITRLCDIVGVPHPYDSYEPSNDDNIDIREVSARIAAEPGWVRL